APRRGPSGRALATASGGGAERAAVEALLRQPSDPDGRYAALYDNLRTAANGQPTRSVVFAGATAPVGVNRVVAGLAAHVRRTGHRVLLAHLADSGGSRTLQPVAADGDARWNEAPPLGLDLSSHAESGAIQGWLRAHAGDADLVCIAAGALGAVDAALLACACDGLVLVVHAEHTAAAALRHAVERAHAVGCRPLGLVVVGSRDPLPAWLRHLLPAAPNGGGA
ncbi:MAG: hypothetical protein SF182_10535, partial [Deltaproteobacteria bacterium]|nr:hypothetical protein [Deltaproteobacteria bacterium]